MDEGSCDYREETSVSKLADLDQIQLRGLWLFYKKTFNFKKKTVVSTN